MMSAETGWMLVPSINLNCLARCLVTGSFSSDVRISSKMPLALGGICDENLREHIHRNQAKRVELLCLDHRFLLTVSAL